MMTDAFNPAPIEALYNGLVLWIESGVQDPKQFGSHRELPFFSDGVLYARLGLPIAYILPTSATEVKTLFVTAVKLKLQSDNRNTAHGDGQIRNILLSAAKAKQMSVFYCINPEQYSWIQHIGAGQKYDDPELFANNIAAEWMGLVAQAIYFYKDSQESDGTFSAKRYSAQQAMDCVNTLRWIKAKIDGNPDDAVIKITKEMIEYGKNEADVERLFGDLKKNLVSFAEELAELRAQRQEPKG